MRRDICRNISRTELLSTPNYEKMVTCLKMCKAIYILVLRENRVIVKKWAFNTHHGFELNCNLPSLNYATVSLR